ncbi:hypothetical protein [Brevundimonas sp.]|uniref:hypothetical protein n=1 Tax=Brevundimonas sp. TaxID=1871086 RepID=UPI001A236AA1|nr:hypothetical protein [Brevundimonas sp.]MBJ7484088.1 hypothetical protein [Brevundimonas sp.]
MTFAIWAVVIVLATIWLGTWALQVALVVVDLVLNAVVWTVALVVCLVWLGTRALRGRIKAA